ncbi:Lcl C-terminal domain-containing protein [Parabacteroides sp.]
MKQIKKLLIIVLLLSGMGITILQAQTASTITLGGKQYPVVDLTELAPLGCVLTKKQCDERKAEMHAKSPSLTTAISGNQPNDEWNKKISSKFQVMNADYNNGTMSWVDAWNNCKNYTGTSDGGSSQAGQWRLPNHKELRMISIVYPQLLAQGLITAFAANFYWSSTEFNNNTAWTVTFLTGYTNYPNKTSANRVRCIRDLP